jgi:hypothetical protein
VDEVADVDVHMLQPGNGWVPWWKSEIYPAQEHYRWYKEKTGLSMGRIGEYMLEGGDLAAVFVKRCRQRGVSPFISLRLNDYHGSEYIDLINDLVSGKKDKNKTYTVGGTHCGSQSRFRLENPEYRLEPDPLIHKSI